MSTVLAKCNDTCPATQTHAVKNILCVQHAIYLLHTAVVKYFTVEY